MKHWLVKSEPDVFSIDDLRQRKVEPWDGVRNYQARNFMRELFVHVLANTQLGAPLLTPDALPDTRNKGAVEEVFVKGAKIQTLALGLTYFLKEEFKSEEGFLRWASQTALQTLRTGMDVIPEL